MRRTKIVCTIGPATQTQNKLRLLIKNGMNIARLNFSHGSHSWFKQTIKNIRGEAKKLKKPVAILQDLCGPKIRLGKDPKDGIQLKMRQKISLVYKAKIDTLTEDEFSCNFNLSKHLKKGQLILLDDGKAQLEVQKVDKKNKSVTFISHSNHYLKPNKGINLPDTTLEISSLTEKDIKDIIFGVNFKPEYIALSFVKKAGDIARLKRILRKYKINSQIIAKIETSQALQELDSIIEAADGIMIARGDLGLETPIEQLPLVQKAIVQKCIFANKPVIVATQMLASMTHNPIPTRAEATDVANAVFDNVDAVMLSEESAVGDFPIKSVSTLNNICQTTDETIYVPENNFISNPDPDQLNSIAQSACQLALDIEAKYIIIPSLTGRTARAISSHRPPTPIVATTNSETLLNQLVLNWGVTPVFTKAKTLETKLTQTIKQLRRASLLKRGDQVVIVTSSNSDALEADSLRIKKI